MTELLWIMVFIAVVSLVIVLVDDWRLTRNDKPPVYDEPLEDDDWRNYPGWGRRP